MPKRPSQVEIDRRKAAIERSLMAMQARLSEKLRDTSSVDVFVNSDGSVDGQLRIKQLGRQDDVKGLLADAEHGLREERPSRSWLSVGFRFPHDERVTPENYERWRGLLQAQAYYQQTTESKVPLHFRRARKIYGWLRDAGRRKPSEVFVRIQWNANNDHPVVPGSRRGAFLSKEGKGRYKRKRRKSKGKER